MSMMQVDGEDNQVMVLNTGDQVTLRGLQSRPELNGKSGHVLSYDDGKKRYVVQIDGERLSVKPSNLLDHGLSQEETQKAWESGARHMIAQMLLGSGQAGSLEEALAMADGTHEPKKDKPAEASALRAENVTKAEAEALAQKQRQKRERKARKNQRQKAQASGLHASIENTKGAPTPSVDGQHGRVERHADYGCAICQKSGTKTYQCSKCFAPRRYCSVVCQTVDWSTLGHKEKCKRLQTLNLDIIASAQGSESESALEQASHLKTRGNAKFRSGEFAAAVQLYETALDHAVAGRRALELGDSTDLFSKKYHDASRLAAEASVNASMAYLRLYMLNGEKNQRHAQLAAATARDGVVLDPTYAGKSFRKLVEAMTVLDNESAYEDMQRRMHLFDCMQPKMLNTAMLAVDIISNSNFEKRQAATLGAFLVDARTNSLLGPPPGKTVGKWATVALTCSLVPFRGGQWLCISLHNSSNEPLLHNAHFLCADAEGDPDAVDVKKDGKKSRGGTNVALAKSRVEIPAFARSLDDRGLLVMYIVLGAGLFGIHAWSAGGPVSSMEHAQYYPLAIDESTLPKNCSVTLAQNHIQRDLRTEGAAGSMMADFQQEFAKVMGTGSGEEQGVTAKHHHTPL